MTACMTYHLTKTLRMWGQKALASRLNDFGRKLLSLDGAEKGAGNQTELAQGLPADEGNNDDDGDGGNKTDILSQLYEKLID